MISFRAISASADARATVDYLLNGRSVSRADDASAAAAVDSRDAIVKYYTGDDHEMTLRPDMPLAVARALGIDAGSPLTREQLARLYQGKRADADVKWAGGERKTSAYDFTFSPHKSITLAAEFAESPAEAAAIRTAIARANDAAIRYIAKEIGYARKGKAGRDGADPGETGWISYTHYDARPTVSIKDGPAGETRIEEAPVPGDPQEHVHNTLFNLVVTDDGRVGSLDTKRMRSRVHEFGAYGQARLADELRKLGIRVAYDAKEQAVVIPVIPEIANEAFSKREKQILREAKDSARSQGQSWDSLSGDEKLKIIARAATASRLAKHAAKSDREIWRVQAEAIGWEHKTVLEGTVPEPLTDDERFDRAYAFAARHLAEKFRTAAVVDRDLLRTFAARGLIGTGIQGGPDDIDKVVTLLEQRGLEIDGEKAGLIAAWVKPSDPKAQPEEVLRVTNSVQVRIEQELVAEVRRAARDKSGALSPEALRTAIDASGLDFSAEPEHGKKQIAAIHALGQSGAVSLLTGFAGAGKSTLLKPLVQAWRADARFSPDGREIIGISNAWKQANALQDGGISRTIALDPLLRAIDAGEIAPTSNTIFVIDEISQASPKAMLRLLELQAQTGMSIKALGDREQAQAIEASDTIELMRRALPKEAQPQLLSTVRQARDQDRKIAALFREQAADQALALKRRDGTARLVGGDYDQVANEIADLYLARRDILRATGATKGVTISTLTNEDAAQISIAIRDKLKKRGEIGADEILYQAIAPRGDGKPILFDLPVASGDQVRLYRYTWAKIGENYGAIGNNGDIVKVIGRTDAHIYLEDQKGRVGEVEWRRLIHPETGRLLLGYGHALTIDSAQGITSDEHINALPRGSAGVTAFKAYVAESRARGATWTMISKAAVLEIEKTRRPLGDARKITDEDLWKRVAADMAHKPYKALGLDVLNSTRRLKSAAVDSFIRQSHAFHGWRAQGSDAGKDARERAWDKTLSGALSARLGDLMEGVRQNASLLRDALAALDAYLRARHARGVQSAKLEEPQPGPRPSSPSPGV